MPTARFNPIKFVISLVIDYFRWTQLAPMVTVWGFGLLMLVALFFVNYQEESFDAVFAAYEWIAGLPLLGEPFAAWMHSLADDNGTASPGGFDIKAATFKVWGYLSLAMMLIALTANWIFGPIKPWTLKRKLGVAALCCAVLLAGFMAMYFAQPRLDQEEIPIKSWLFSFGGVSLLLFIVSTWCLSIAHLLGLLRKSIDESSLGTGNPPKPPYTVNR